jgi:hypothetical protein
LSHGLGLKDFALRVVLSHAVETRQQVAKHELPGGRFIAVPGDPVPLDSGAWNKESIGLKREPEFAAMGAKNGYLLPKSNHLQSTDWFSQTR